MKLPKVNDRVRLEKDIPELALHRGCVGVVRSTWFAPSTAYEVEFHQQGLAYATRALILADNLSLADDVAKACSN